MKKLFSMCFLSFAVLFLMALGADTAAALDNIPIYDVTEIGTQLIAANPNTSYSTALKVNQQGDAVGWAVIDGQTQPFIYTAEHGPLVLPNLPGRPAGRALDLTNRLGNGEMLAVGALQSSIFDEPGLAVLWRFQPATNQVLETVLIGALDGSPRSEATGINDEGLVVGYSTGGGLGVGSPAMLFNAVTRVLEPLDFPALPRDINNRREVVGGRWWKSLVTGELRDLGVPAGDVSASLAAINEALPWQATGSAGTSHTDGSGQFVNEIVRFTDGAGWKVIIGRSSFDTGKDINLHGDLVGILGLSAATRPVLYIDALDELFLLQDLISADLENKYVTESSGINDIGQIAGSGTGGAVLLTSLGDMPTPTAPANLTATLLPEDRLYPNGTIRVTWEETSPYTREVKVERQPGPNGEPGFTLIQLSGNGTDGILSPLELSTTYTYRAQACGLAGCSEYSNTDSATTRSEPADNTPPVVTFINPIDGAEVSGTVQIVVEASDNKGLNYVEVRPPGGLCTAAPDGATFHQLTCNWNTRQLDPGTYTITAYASDLLGNGTNEAISVVVGNANPTLHSASVDLSASLKRGVVSVKGTVAVTDETGAGVRSAIVSATWTLPDGTTLFRTAYSDRKGSAKFSVSGDRGAYTLTVTNITKSGYTFDAANSVLSASVTR